MTLLYTLTMVLFAGVIVTRYFTYLHTNKLKERHVKADYLCQRLEHRYRVALKEREAIEREEKSVESQGKVVEAQLEELKQDLMEEEQRVNSLEEQLADMKD